MNIEVSHYVTIRMLTIKYSEADFVREKISWEKLNEKSKLDETIETQFENAMKNGVLVSNQPLIKLF